MRLTFFMKYIGGVGKRREIEIEGLLLRRLLCRPPRSSEFILSAKVAGGALFFRNTGRVHTVWCFAASNRPRFKVFGNPCNLCVMKEK